ncbi:MAG: hypothetical protein ABF289_18375 [Clostridiales bacterium]
MAEIKLIDKNTDFTKLKMELMKWDTYSNKEYYDVYRIENHFHSIGGKWGNNNYWASPRGEKPTYDNLIEFSGVICSWGMRFYESNFIKTKWNETEMNDIVKFEITRNDKIFYDFIVRDIEYGIAKARKIMIEIHEHPIPFNEQNFEKQIVGRKIKWMDKPSVIESYSINWNLIVVPDGWDIREYRHYEGGEESISEDLFDNSIDWFRD